MPTETAVVVEEQALTAGDQRHLKALEKRIEQGLQTFREVGQALLEIRDTRLYRDSHGTFEDYCRDRWQLDKTRAYQFIGAAEVVKMLGDPKELKHETQARELVPLMHEDPKAVKRVWEKVVATNEPITAALIREVRSEVMETDNGTVSAPSATDALLGRITGLISAYQRWDKAKPTRKERSIINAALAKLDEIVG